MLKRQKPFHCSSNAFAYSRLGSGFDRRTEKIRRNAPDVVVSDIVMPGMDGVELLNEARAAGMNVPFLMISGFPSHLDAVKVMKQGALDYLAKPFHPETLTRRIRCLLLDESAARSLVSIKGIMMGTAISAILWACIIGMAFALFS
jgi:DNA-binding response OmpR family regulator